MNADVQEARRHLLHRRAEAGERANIRVVSRQERDAAVIVLTDWLERTKPRQFRFGDACAELFGDADLTREALRIIHGSGLVHLNNRVYHYGNRTNGAFRW